jgi:hypothetical protein
MLDSNQLHIALQTAPPGTVLEATVRIIIPGARAVQDEGIASVPQGASAPEPPRPETEVPTESPVDRLRSMATRVGGEFRKESEWAADLCRAGDFSARELDRACRAGAISHAEKEWGRDAGARLIHYTALETYLVQREAVLHGGLAKPDWWDRVVTRRTRPAA